MTYLDTGCYVSWQTTIWLSRNQLEVEQVEALLALLDQHPISFMDVQKLENSLSLVGDGILPISSG